jgi:hypothetical protein
MPTYDYYCESNDRTVEVSHKLAEQLSSWGDLCERAGIDAGRTDPKASVHKLITGGAVLTSKGAASAPPCETTGVCCGGGACGLQ